MQNLKKKLKQNKGFSFAELLVATIILLLTSGMLVVCIQLGMKQLYKQTQDSEAQMLCTTLSTAIQDELTYASEVSVSSSTAGNTITFAKEGMSDAVGFYIASETEDGDATDPSTFEFTAVTDDSAFSAINLGKIYLASTDDSNNITDVYGLVSTGAYNIENSSYGSLRAGMQLSKNSSGYEVTVNIYNGSDDTTPLATKEFYVGKVTADRTDEVDVDTSSDTMTRTLIFEPNGGKFSDNSTTAKTYKGLTVGTTFSTPSVSRLPGYDFAGWKDENGSLTTSGSVTVAEDMTYTAQWNVKSYTAYFYLDSSAMANGNSLTTISGEYGTTMQLPTPGNLTSIQKDGYDFAGWEDESGNVYPVDGATWTVTGNQKFVATWTPKKYTVSFYKNYDSSGNPTDLIETKEVYYMDTLDFPDEPVMEHYDFKGWEYERALDDKVTTNVGSMVYSFTKDMTFVAKWEDHEYTATFFYEVDGNRTVIDEAQINYGDTLSFPTPSVDGYEVSGWKYTDNGSEILLGANTASLTYDFNKDMEFEAVLTPYYVASFYLDTEAETSLEKQNVYKEGNSYSITLPTKNGVMGMEKSGYTFQNWIYTLDGENWLTGNPGDVVTMTGDMNFYGVWVMDDYTITFYNGKTKVAVAVCDASGNISGFKEGYSYDSFAGMQTGLNHSDNTNTTTYWTLDGWYYISGQTKTKEFNADGTATGGAAASFSSIFANTANVNLYAGWKNTQAVYELSDTLSSGDRFLIVGGNAIGANQKALTNSGNNDVTTANVTVRGDSICQYVLTNNGAANSAEWYTSDADGGRLYIRKTINNSVNRYLDIDTPLFGSDKLKLVSNDNGRQWTYENHQLRGYYFFSFSQNLYVTYSNNSFNNISSSSSSNGNIYIYVKKSAGQVISFNGFDQ